MPEKVTKLTAVVPGWTIDYEADAAYLQLRHAAIDRTLNFGLVNLDLDADGQVVGVEVLTLGKAGEFDQEPT
jgi:uncharacterized protein YuzE